jgi:GTP-binding protein LepA
MNKSVRNFVIIAHIDHGKSTLADRFLELTGTVPARKMHEQYLDNLELERERGITIKMAPVRMEYKNVMLNLIDTPGHSDFSYEVSRALGAVEGAILLVDATQGVQAQTLATLNAARETGLKVIGAVNKIDMNPPGVDDIILELAELLGVNTDEIHKISARKGDGVEKLLNAVVSDIPEPKSSGKQSALIFSSLYDDHKGIIAFVRVFGGNFRAHENSRLLGAKRDFKIKEVGFFSPEFTPRDSLEDGEIGYVATGIKDPDAIRIGDTIGKSAVAGFRVPNPVVFVSFYPNDAGDYDNLKVGLNKLRLNDSSLVFSADFSPVLGRGFKCGFLGRLHFEITMQRLEREFNLSILNSFPSVEYKVETRGGKKVTIQNPRDFPDDSSRVLEPYVSLRILLPSRFLGSVMDLKKLFRLGEIKTETVGAHLSVKTEMPLADLILDFDDKLKSVSEGFASFSYEFSDYREADVKKLDILIAGEQVPGLSRIVPRKDLEYEGRKMVQKLKELLPRQQFPQAVQAVVGGDIIARETISALRKNVTGHLYGGDRTRKDKLLKKQKAGKKKMQARGRAQVPASVFRELLKR